MLWLNKQKVFNYYLPLFLTSILLIVAGFGYWFFSQPQEAEAAVVHIKNDVGFCAGASVGGNMIANCNGPSSYLSKNFIFTPTNAGDTVLIFVSCAAGQGTVTNVTLSASGWAFNQIGSITGNTTTGFAAAFWATSPNTSQATITQTWTASGNNCGTGTAGAFLNDMIGEFSGTNSSSPVDAVSCSTSTGCNSAASASGSPTVNLTPATDNDMIWAASNDSITAVGNIGGSIATKDADDTTGDWSEYRLLSGGAGVQISAAFTGGPGYTIFAVALKPQNSSTIPFAQQGGTFFQRGGTVIIH